MVLGYKKPLTEDDLWSLNAEDKAQELGQKFTLAWEKEVKTGKCANFSSNHVSYSFLASFSYFFSCFFQPFPAQRPSLLRALFRAYGGPYIVAAFFKLAQDLLSFCQPLLLEKLIDFINTASDDPQPKTSGYFLAVGMFFAALLQTVMLHQYFHRCFVTGMRVRTGLVTAIYSKSLIMSSDARQKYSSAEMVNHMSVDAQRLMDLCSYAHILWSGPLQIALSLYFLYGVLGPSVFAGLAVMILMIPLNSWTAVKMRTVQKKQMGLKDKRIRLMDEVLAGIKVIKLYAWEKSFLGRIFGVRSDELANLKVAMYMHAIQSFMWTSAPFLVSLASFGVYVAVSDSPLTSDVAFVSLSLFNLLQFPLAMFPQVLSSSVESSVGINRLWDFLSAAELDTQATIKLSRDELIPGDHSEEKGNLPIAVQVKDGTFKWSAASQANTLQDISFEVREEALIAVVGAVGSGKSSLVSALLGDMTKVGGKVVIRGSGMMILGREGKGKVG